MSDAVRACYRDVHSDAGGAQIWSVILPDGYVIDCGSGGYAQMRAKRLRDIINRDDGAAVGLSESGLKGWMP